VFSLCIQKLTRRTLALERVNWEVKKKREAAEMSKERIMPRVDGEPSCRRMPDDLPEWAVNQ
jgi:hypothetical protein